MAPRQANRNIQKVGRQDLVRKNKRTRPQDIKQEQPQPSARRSTRLQRIAPKNTNTEPKLPLPSPTSNTPGKEFPQAGDRKRKRKQSQEDEAPRPLSLLLRSGRGCPL
ncbi:hypothetical protein BKA65DRAFT_483555 [Rhexocercosporidium sp. MPI-PUGE-AT-0058]|nr:hypothetical protein BKA65DRAFT_483555 [Rhexocercosporidium sp. MPI-PUGE-AT-0058]